MKLADNPFLLLLGTGASLAMITPLGKLALEAGINPFLWAGLIALLPSLALFWFVPKPDVPWTSPALWKFGLLAGVTANLIPSSLLLLAIPHIGSGLGGLMYALSPVVTATLSLLLRVRPPNTPLLIAVALGFVGAVIVVAGRNALALPSAPQWLLLAMLVPCSLAVGNVYRTARWPQGASPAQIGVVVNSSVVPFFVLLAWAHGGAWQPLLTHGGLVAAQALAGIVNVGLFFRLQWISGPTYLSQIGYVAAGISLSIGTLLLGETYPWQVWLGASLIIAGLGASAFEIIGKKPA